MDDNTEVWRVCRTSSLTHVPAAAAACIACMIKCSHQLLITSHQHTCTLHLKACHVFWCCFLRLDTNVRVRFQKLALLIYSWPKICIWLQKIKQLVKTTQGSMIWGWTEVRLASNKWSEKGKGMTITCRLSILTLLCCTVSLLLVKRGDKRKHKETTEDELSKPLRCRHRRVGRCCTVTSLGDKY